MSAFIHSDFQQYSVLQILRSPHWAGFAGVSIGWPEAFELNGKCPESIGVEMFCF